MSGLWSREGSNQAREMGVHRGRHDRAADVQVMSASTVLVRMRIQNVLGELQGKRRYGMETRAWRTEITKHGQAQKERSSETKETAPGSQEKG